MQERKDERYEFEAKVFWTFFAQGSFKMPGYLKDISRSGCLLKTYQTIECRRWLRFIVQDPSSNLFFTAIGRVVRAQTVVERTQFEYGIQFTFPNYFSLAGIDVISALSRRNLMVRSCRSLNSKSPLRPEFLA